MIGGEECLFDHQHGSYTKRQIALRDRGQVEKVQKKSHDKINYGRDLSLHLDLTLVGVVELTYRWERVISPRNV